MKSKTNPTSGSPYKADVAILDVPWGTPGQRGRLGAASKYPVLSIDNIKTFPLNDYLKNDAWVLFWTTNENLWVSREILEDAWGLTLVKQPITWFKNRLGLGSPLRNSTEHLLLAKRGHPRLDSRSVPTHLYGAIRSHSEKPHASYEVAEALVKNGDYIEFFSRNVPRSEGARRWVLWGLDAPDNRLSVPGWPTPADFDEQEVA